MSEQNPFRHLRLQIGKSLADLAPELGFSESTLRRWEKGQSVARKSVIKLMESMIRDRHARDLESGSISKKFRFIDLFAGIGGLRRGFENIGGHCVFTSEWNKYAQQTYQANFIDDEGHEFAGDITEVDAAEIPDHEVLLAGFPCQPFSLAGVSKKQSLGRKHGFLCESQGTLFFDVARIIDHHRPAAFLLENVKNLMSHDKGNTFRVIRETLEDHLGYQIHYRVIDAKSFVPQHRERIFIAGFRSETEFSFEDLMVPDVHSGPKLKSILHPEDGSESADSHYVDHRGKVDKRYTLSDKLWDYLQRYAEKHRAKGNGFGFGLVGPEDTARTLSARYYKDGSEILIKRKRGNPRRLTPRECARLMGFDRPGESKFQIPVSDTQAYKQFGNAVVVPVIESIAQHMSPWLPTLDGNAIAYQKEIAW